MERVELANRNQGFLMTITAAVVFGSYLRGGERIGDLDLAIELEPKMTPKDSIGISPDVRGSLRKVRSGLPLRRLRIRLGTARGSSLSQNRKRTLSIHTMRDFVAMDKTPVFLTRFSW